MDDPRSYEYIRSYSDDRLRQITEDAEAALLHRDGKHDGREDAYVAALKAEMRRREREHIVVKPCQAHWPNGWREVKRNAACERCGISYSKVWFIEEKWTCIECFRKEELWKSTNA